jgi:hypothetical protein
MERAEYQNALETLRKQADICQNHLSVFKIEDRSDQENKHRPQMESKLTQSTPQHVIKST